MGRSRGRVSSHEAPDLVTLRTSMTTRMDRLLLLPLILILQAGTLCRMETVTQIIGQRGGAIHLPVIVPPEFNIRDVFWRHLSPTDHLVASVSRGSLDTTYQSCFYGRVQLLHNFTLVILNLELKDTGLFTSQMVDTNGRMRLHQFHLTVYEVVVKPEIQVYTSRGTMGCSVFLACNTSMGSNVTYSWMTDTGQGQPLNRTYSLHDDSRLLNVLLTSRDQEVSFTCIVTNFVSQEETNIAPWTYCFIIQEPEAPSSSGKVFLIIGIFLLVSFAFMMFSVFILTRVSNRRIPGKNNIKNIEVKVDEETLSQHNEETGGQENTRLQNCDEIFLERETSV
ncbi:SLAM family member 8 isoform X2 [Phyllobates terribilis]|uniref:SLAM family member 8 isoform X2 n=1 Tax=Phyllobates terribilis TaxID=111132 RepID=UPI003CCB1799